MRRIWAAAARPPVILPRAVSTCSRRRDSRGGNWITLSGVSPIAKLGVRHRENALAVHVFQVGHADCHDLNKLCLQIYGGAMPKVNLIDLLHHLADFLGQDHTPLGVGSELGVPPFRILSLTLPIN